MLINYKRNSGFTIAELLVSSSIVIVVLSIITSFFYSFNKISQYRMSKMDLNSTLRVSVNRLNKEFLSSINVIRKTSDIILNGNVNFRKGSSPSQLLLSTSAYDIAGNPMFETNRTLKKDLVGLKILPVIPNQKVIRNGIEYNLYKISLTVQPAPDDPGIDGVLGNSDDIKNSRKPISNQSIFSSLMPVSIPATDPSLISGGTYILPIDSGYTDTQKIFSYYTNYKAEITNLTDINAPDISSIKINLFGEKVIFGKSVIARQENEIVFRNFQ